jgi:ABC-type spermidine/putrescine transport system permease subunit I
MNYSYIEPPIGLFEKILKRIHREERFLVLRHAAIFSAMLVGSLAAFIPVVRMLLSDAKQSGFLRFFSLIFSDFSTVTTYWQSFSMALLQTLPVISIVALLAVLLVFLQSLKSLSKDLKFIYHGKGYSSVKTI